MAQSVYLKLETRIASDERDGIVHRWRYGRKLLEAKAGRKQLPHGMIGDLLNAAGREGLHLTEREIQRRIKCATAYGSEAEVRRAATDFGSWTALHEAGFPSAGIDGMDAEPDELEAAGISTGSPDEFEQLTLIPGIAPVLKVDGRKVPVDAATIADVRAYRDMYRQIHDNYAKRLDQIETALEIMLDGADGDEDMNAIEAWRLGQPS